MATKLDSLIVVLVEEGMEKKELDQIIIDFFQNQDTSEFETEEGIYKVLTDREIEDELYDVAEIKFYDAENELDNMSYGSNLGGIVLGYLIKAIDRDTAIEHIVEDLDYEEEFDVSLIGKSGHHTIYLVN